MNVKRITTGVLLGVLVFLSLISGGWMLSALVFLFILMASREYVKILKNKGFLPSFGIMVTATVALTFLAHFNKFSLVAPAFSLLSILALMWVLFRGSQPYIANAATTILGFVYCAWFPLHLLFLRSLPAYNCGKGVLSCFLGCTGLGYVILLFFVVLVTDVGCYYFGTRFGKHKLAPVISPNKTWEGAIGGSVSAILVSFFIGWLLGFEWYHSLFTGIVITVFAQIGDLCESMFKRDAGVKDSGDTLPGHGGFLDRADSYILTTPILFYYFKYVVLTGILKVDILMFIRTFFNV